MSLVIPNTLASKTGQAQLGLLDDNFTYIVNALDPLMPVNNKTSLGNNSIVSTANPINLDLGATYSSVAGQNSKLILWSDGAGTTFGLGVSLHQQDYSSPADADHVFYIGTTEKLRITNTNTSLTTGLSISNNPYGFVFNQTTGKMTTPYTNTLYGFNLSDDGRGFPTPTNKTKVVFTYTGAVQSWTVPAGVTYIFAKVWGAGGGGGNVGGWVFGSTGGGGGYTRGIIPVTAGQVLPIVVGQAGMTCWWGPGNNSSTQTGGFGGGGGLYSNVDNRYAGSGGGYSGIFNSTGVITQANALLIAGGGGGGGSSRSPWDAFERINSSQYWTGAGYGGAGGGLQGQAGGAMADGRIAMGGWEGTQLRGGYGGGYGANTLAASAAGGTGAGGASLAGYGGALYGGIGGTSQGYGGGGGGGYFGGGGGAYVEPNTMAGGGGGSGYINPSVLFSTTVRGNYNIPGGTTDVDFPNVADPLHNTSIYCYGGWPSTNTMTSNAAGFVNNWGGSGYVVIYY